MGGTDGTIDRPLSRRAFLGGAIGSAVSLTGLGFSHAAPVASTRARRPNVLFIAVDDLRPQLGCYGHTQMISPNIDRLAGEGMLFSRSYCQVPVCGASRASLLTGVRPTPGRFVNFSTRADKDAPGVTVLPKHFRRHGYHTLSAGKVFHHLADSADAWSEAAWRPQQNPRGYITPESLAMVRRTRNPSLPGRRGRGRGPAQEAPDVGDSEYADGKLADKAIADLRRLKGGEKPFFLALGFFKPHLPFTAPKKYWDLYPRDRIDLADNPFRPKGAPDAALHNWGELRNGYTGIPPKGPLPAELARTLVHGYYACVSYIDAQIGRVLTELRRLGLGDNTIVVLWGDHGWNLGEHGLWCKHCNFETSLHSPLLIRAPGFPRGLTSPALTEYVDIYPTLCDLAGLPQPKHLEGSSLVPLLANPAKPWKTAVFSRFRNGDSVKTHRYRYTQWRRGTAAPYARMLYDHKTDPHENVNLSERPAHQALVQQMQRTLQAGWKAVRAKL